MLTNERHLCNDDCPYRDLDFLQCSYTNIYPVRLWPIQNSSITVHMIVDGIYYMIAGQLNSTVTNVGQHKSVISLI